MQRRNWLRIVVLTLVTASPALIACQANEPRPVAKGNYAQVDKGPMTLEVNRDASRVTVRAGAETVERGFSTTPQDKWPVHCRTNFKGQALEVLTLDGGALAIGGHSYDKPVVSADCGAQGRVLLTVPTEEGYGKFEGAVLFEPVSK